MALASPAHAERASLPCSMRCRVGLPVEPDNSLPGRDGVIPEGPSHSGPILGVKAVASVSGRGGGSA